MSTEETPLLLPDVAEQVAEERHNVIYTKFSPWKKGVIVSIVSWAGFLPRAFREYQCCIQMFNPAQCLLAGHSLRRFLRLRRSSIRMVQRSGASIQLWLRCDHLRRYLGSLAISLSILTTAFAGMTWAAYSGFCEFLRKYSLYKSNGIQMVVDPST